MEELLPYIHLEGLDEQKWQWDDKDIVLNAFIKNNPYMSALKMLETEVGQQHTIVL